MQKVKEAGGAFTEPIKNLNAVELPSLPLVKLRLKTSILIIYIYNINPRERLYNSTRLVVLDIKRRVLKVIIIGSELYSAIRLIPRISLYSSLRELTYILRRKQFLVKPCFVIIINKS